MAKLSPEEIARLAAGAGWTGNDLDTAVAVALAESKGGDPNAIGDVGIQTAEYGPSVGLWQIRSVNPGHGGWFDKKHHVYQDNLDPETNARNAHAIWERYGWGRWSTYTNGKYKDYLDQARRATGNEAPPPLPTKKSDAGGGSGGGSGGNGVSAVLDQLKGALSQFQQQSNRLRDVAKQTQNTVARGSAFGEVPGSQVAAKGNQANANRSQKQADDGRARVDGVHNGVKDSGDRYQSYDEGQGQRQQQQKIQIDNAYDAYRNYA